LSQVKAKLVSKASRQSQSVKPVSEAGKVSKAGGQSQLVKPVSEAGKVSKAGGQSVSKAGQRSW
jgi:hypothetical protein